MIRPRGLRRSIADLPGERRAATAMEFGVLSPVFLLLVFYCFQIALQLFAQMAMDYAVFDASRQLQLGDNATPPIRTADDFRSVVCRDAGPLIVNCAATLQVSAQTGSSFAVLQALAAKPDAQGAFVPAGFDRGGGGASVIVQAAYRMPYIVGWLSQITNGSGTLLLSAIAFKNEPYS